MKTVAVVGAGFSGTMTACGLLRRSKAVRVALIERSGQFGRGLAYGAARGSHVLNVPAGRMGAWPDSEGDFLRWLRVRDSAAEGGSFVRRRLYGQYLADLLAESEQGAGAGRLLRIGAGAIGAERRASGGWKVLCEGAPPVEAEALVLAMGNFSPAPPPIASQLPREGWINDPWENGALDAVGAHDDVMLIGTGLTMYDIALELRDRGHTGRMVAISRRGLRPQPHRASSKKPAHHEPPESRHAWAPTALGALRGVRREVRQAAEEGIDWREAITSLRPVTAELWSRWNEAEKGRFLERVRPYWDSHRHRAAPEIHEAVEALISAGRLAVRGGRIGGARVTDGAVEVSVRPRGGGPAQTHRVQRVINCTGPDSDFRRSGGPLAQSLLMAGALWPDAHGLGLRSTPDGRALRADGAPNDDLWMIGPLRRPELWETTAVPELREQAAALAARLAE